MTDVQMNRIRMERRRRRAKQRRIRKLLQFSFYFGVVVILLSVGGIGIKWLAEMDGNDVSIDRVKTAFGKSRSSDISQMTHEEIRQTDMWKSVFENRELYPDVMLETLEKNPEIVEFVKNYPDAQPVAAGGFSAREREQQYPLFLQWDARWGYVPYGDDNVGLSGCGPACLSMVIFSLTGNENATPDVIAEFSENNGYYVYGEGTSWSLMTDAAAYYGVKTEELSLGEGNMKGYLDGGGMIICSMGPGDFTSSGHFIVIYGYDQDGFLVNDPFSRIRSSRSWSYDTISGQIRSMWGYIY
ncbi:MAG: C39 family peptidase [Lachnospiraceae bacterium]|nr:C39 family peptidase [Lachnospiraceae bacterium]